MIAGRSEPDTNGFGNLDEFVGGLSSVTRREFLKFCTGVATVLGLGPALGATIAQAATAVRRPSVIWISAQECTGCTESLLRAHHPTLETLILDLISLDYHEALNAGAGHQAEAFRHQAMAENHGQYLLVIDGSIPTKDGGIYCKVAGKTIQEHLADAVPGAAAVVEMGSCASWGGVAAAGPNPTEARPAHEFIRAIDPAKPVVSIPGCPPNPYNLLATVLHYLTFGRLPELDTKNRPIFAYGRLIHENCERRPHFDAGRFALDFGDPGHRQGFCLYKLGCKGPETYANCPAVGFGDVGQGNWPVGAGHGCFGCTEEGVGFHKPIHELSVLQSVTPPTAFPRVAEEQGGGATLGAVALTAGAVGAAFGAGAVLVSRLGRQPDEAQTAAGAKAPVPGQQEA